MTPEKSNDSAARKAQEIANQFGFDPIEVIAAMGPSAIDGATRMGGLATGAALKDFPEIGLDATKEPVANGSPAVKSLKPLVTPERKIVNQVTREKILANKLKRGHPSS